VCFERGANLTTVDHYYRRSCVCSGLMISTSRCSVNLIGSPLAHSYPSKLFLGVYKTFFEWQRKILPPILTTSLTWSGIKLLLTSAGSEGYSFSSVYYYLDKTFLSVSDIGFLCFESKDIIMKHGLLFFMFSLF
jgi:hypothetical protein